MALSSTSHNPSADEIQPSSVLPSNSGTSAVEPPPAPALALELEPPTPPLPPAPALSPPAPPAPPEVAALEPSPVDAEELADSAAGAVLAPDPAFPPPPTAPVLAAEDGPLLLSGWLPSSDSPHARPIGAIART